MANFHKTITDFTGGLMSPHLRGRVDIDKFNKGLKQMENFLPSIQGPTRYREGFKWLGTEATGNVKLLDFSINNQNRYLIMFAWTDLAPAPFYNQSVRVIHQYYYG